MHTSGQRDRHRLKHIHSLTYKTCCMHAFMHAFMHASINTHMPTSYVCTLTLAHTKATHTHTDTHASMYVVCAHIRVLLLPSSCKTFGIAEVPSYTFVAGNDGRYAHDRGRDQGQG